MSKFENKSIVPKYCNDKAKQIKVKQRFSPF